MRGACRSGGGEAVLGVALRRLVGHSQLRLAIPRHGEIIGASPLVGQPEADRVLLASRTLHVLAERSVSTDRTQSSCEFTAFRISDDEGLVSIRQRLIIASQRPASIVTRF